MAVMAGNQQRQDQQNEAFASGHKNHSCARSVRA
jgi:hypothetical protein